MGIIVPLPAPRPTSLPGSPAQLNVFLTHPGVQARNLASCRSPPSPAPCPGDQAFSKSHGFCLLWLSPPLLSSSATANIWVQSLISYQYCCDCSVLRLCSYFKLLPEKKLSKTVKLFTSGGMLVREDSVDIFCVCVSILGGKRKKNSEKPSLHVSQRVPVQLHMSCSEKQETERPKATVPVLHGRPTKVYFSAPLFSPWWGAPFLETLQYQVRARSRWSNRLSQLPAPKIHLIYCPRIEGVSDVKLVSVGNFKGANKGRRYLLLLLAASSCLHYLSKSRAEVPACFYLLTLVFLVPRRVSGVCCCLVSKLCPILCNP